MDVATITCGPELSRVQHTDPSKSMGDSMFRCRVCKYTRGFGNTLRVIVLVRNYADMPVANKVAGDRDDKMDMQIYTTDPTLPRITVRCPTCSSENATFVKIAPRELIYKYTCHLGHTWTNT